MEAIEKDARESYAAVAARGQSKVSACGTLQRIAKAYLKWDKSADKTERKDLQRFASMSLTAENCSWQTEQAFRDAFHRVLVSSAENDRNKEGEGNPQHSAVRAAFYAAISNGASESDVKQVTSALDEIEADGKRNRSYLRDDD